MVSLEHFKEVIMKNNNNKQTKSNSAKVSKEVKAKVKPRTEEIQFEEAAAARKVTAADIYNELRVKTKYPSKGYKINIHKSMKFLVNGEDMHTVVVRIYNKIQTKLVFGTVKEYVFMFNQIVQAAMVASAAVAKKKKLNVKFARLDLDQLHEAIDNVKWEIFAATSQDLYIKSVKYDYRTSHFSGNTEAFGLILTPNLDEPVTTILKNK